LTLATPGFDACYEAGFPNGDLHELCGPVGEISVACDPRLGNVRVTLRRTRSVDERQYDLVVADPCGQAGCALDVGCDTGPTEVLFALANDRTGADWTDSHVALSAGSAGAKFRTCVDDGEPLRLLQTTPDGPRHATALLHFVAAIARQYPATVFAAAPVVSCANNVRCDLALADSSEGNPPDETPSLRQASCTDGTSLSYKVFHGSEPHPWSANHESRYLTIAINLDDLADQGHVDCQVTHAATLAAAPIALGAADVFPVLATYGPLLDADGAIICTELSTDDYTYEDPAILGVEFMRGWNLAPLGETWRGVLPLCTSFDGAAVTSLCD